jgi:hypothetical protein
MEIRIVAESVAEDGNRSVALFAKYRNFQTWYELEHCYFLDGKFTTTKREYWDMGQALDVFDRFVKRWKRG